jgi:molybdenum cofactor biosynthesis enzyme MoaA
VIKALERCASLGVAVTITSVMMRINYDKLPELARVAGAFGANLRVNVYQPAKTDRFSVSYEQFWQGFSKLLESTRLVATTEPVLAAVLGIEDFVGPG